MSDASDVAAPLTVLFADISGSTSMYAARGDVVAHRLTSRCLLQLERAVAEGRGRVVKRLGDGILVAFDDAELAVRAAAVMQHGLEEPDSELRREGIRVRVGIASGTAVVADGDIFGDVVNVAARLVWLASDAEILLARSTHEDLADTARENARLIDKLALRGRPEFTEVYEYLWQRDERATVATSERSRSVQAALELHYAGKTFVVAAASPKVTIGRDADHDISIAAHVVSRHHADVVMQGDKFLLVDRSTNGTYVFTDTGDRIRLAREEFTLTGGGKIFPGSRKVKPVRYRRAAP